MRDLRRGAVLAVVLGCASCAVPTSPTTAPGSSTWSAATGGAPAVGESGPVVAVTDGDTIAVQLPTGRVRVRLLGIDAPEVAHRGSPAACGAEAAQRATERRLGRSSVNLVRDAVSDDVDRYGRLLRYVEDAEGDVGLWLLAEGYVEAWKPSSAASPRRADAYRQAQDAARRAGAGSWSRCAQLGR